MTHLVEQRPSPGDRRRLAEVLGAGPWCWPVEPDPAVLEHAVVAPASRPVAAQAGVTIGVSVSRESDRATLWLLDTRGGADDGPALHSSIAQTWRTAALALPRAIPLLWRSLRALHDRPPRLVWANTWTHDGGDAAPESAVRGESFGLAFALLLGSGLVNLPLPGDLILLATIDADGRTVEVGGIHAKLSAIAAFAPGVRRIAVAATQMAETQQALTAIGAAHLSPQPVRNVAEALELAFGDQALASALAAAGRDAASRAELTRSLFSLVLPGRGELVDWTPVERAAVLTSREGLDAAHQYMLDFAGAVAARHERNEGVLPLPTAEFLESCPVEIAARVLAHLVQHAADTGAPDPEAVRRASQPYRAPSPRLAYLSQLRLEGALARLDAVTGQPRRALVTHRALADLFLDSDLPGEVSFPLSEAYRLAGVLGDRAAFDECERTAARTDAMGGLGLEGSPYVRLARGQALARLGEHAAASDDLSPLAVSAELPAHVRWCAVRWLLQCGGVLESSDITTRAEDALAAAATDPPRVAHAAHVQRALVSLDRGLRGGKEGTAAALDTMRELEAGMVTLLLRWTTPGDEAGHVARHYPY